MTVAEVSQGAGSAHSGDRIAPALRLAESGRIQYQIFDRLGGAAVAHLELARQQDPTVGHDPETEKIAAAFAPHMQRGLTLIGSFGAANVTSAIDAAVAGLRHAGAKGVKVAGVHGDNVRDLLLKHDVSLPRLNRRAGDIGDALLTAHAYIGAEAITSAIADGAQFILGGRICDASLAVGAVCHSLDLAPDDWDSIAVATLVGHLLTGGAGALGGGHADPPYRIVPGIEDIGFPMVRVGKDGFVVSKLADAGGAVTREGLKCRIAYEIHDPSAYLTPDVTADLSRTALEQLGDDEVSVTGVTGRARPDDLLVLATIDRGWLGVAEVGFAGPGCLDRARLGEDIARYRLAELGDVIEDVRVEYFGYSAFHDGNYVAGEPADVLLRITARTPDLEAAQEIRKLAVGIYWGPSGAGAMRRDVRRAIESTEAFLPRDMLTIENEVVVA
jgi:hypothetical protein